MSDQTRIAILSHIQLMKMEYIPKFQILPIQTIPTRASQQEQHTTIRYVVITHDDLVNGQQ